ncbi:MAG: hypothetical protein E7077_06080 [Bacteroidales bacterium]|jgi:hypothetical protein|nr:hypothetical protein [Bacteroidales bacterium]
MEKIKNGIIIRGFTYEAVEQTRYHGCDDCDLADECTQNTFYDNPCELLNDMYFDTGFKAIMFKRVEDER